MTIPHLPVELIYEIVSWCTHVSGPPSLRNLCLVSRQFRQIVQPILLRNIALGENTVAQLNSFSSENGHLASFHARSLIIDLGGCFDSIAERKFFPEEISKLGDQIRPSIESCSKVQRAIWKIRDICDEPPWVQYPIIDALRATKPKELIVTISEDAVTPSIGLLSDISRLSVDYRGSFPVARDALQYGLAKLISESPNIMELELVSRTDPIDLSSVFSIVNYDMEDTSVSLPLEYLGIFGGTVASSAFSLIAERHLRQLKSFALFNNLADGQRGAPERRLPSLDIWSILQEQNIRLTSISTDSSLEGTFVKYLESFAGLRKLRIGVASNDGENTATPEAFMESLIRHHGGTLDEFNIMAHLHESRTWMWPLPDAIAKKLALCPHLTDFGVTISTEDIEESVQEVNAMIGSLIEYANSIPLLEQLTIYQAELVRPSEDYSDFHHFKHDPISKGDVSEIVHDAITSYKSDGTSDAGYRIVVHGSTYGRRLNRDGLFSFNLL